MSTYQSQYTGAEIDAAVGAAKIPDTSLSLAGKAADAKATGDSVAEVKSALNSTVGDVLFNGSHSYAGGAENWNTISLASAISFNIRFPDNSGGSFEVAANISNQWTVLTIISDNEWHRINLPSGFVPNTKIIVTYRGASPVNISCIMIDAKDGAIADIQELQQELAGSDFAYGNDGAVSTSFISSFLNFTACPCKKVDAAGKITSVYIKSYSSGTTKIYIGEVDQLKLFVPRKSFDITVAQGEQNIDVSDLNIFINKGEQALIKFIGQTPFASITGTPEGDTSFYYGEGTLQLQVYGAQRAAVFGFGYTVLSSVDYEQDSQIEENKANIEAVQNDVSVLQANFNVVSDRNGNKYKMIVTNGELSLLPLNFSHVLCVGNSYTTHPTVDDTEPDYSNNLWWGHWSMAASSLSTAWTTLLQNALRQKVNTAKVTPVFGRRYETNPTTYNLNNANTFTYWDGSEWKSLANNVSDFSDVDAIVFFLGANYGGNDWYTLYSAMVEKFLTWFPNASLFCCSCSSSAMAAKDTAIQTVANEEMATYISMVGIGGKSKAGSYVNGDDNTLHQINNNAVAGHFGDYGEYLILNRICKAMGYNNNTSLYEISITNANGVTLSVVSTKTISGAVISVFADVESGITLSSITVTDGSNNVITVTDHGATDYGRVFTFTMPDSDVTVTAVTA